MAEIAPQMPPGLVRVRMRCSLPEEKTAEGFDTQVLGEQVFGFEEVESE